MKDAKIKVNTQVIGGYVKIPFQSNNVHLCRGNSIHKSSYSQLMH